MGSLFLIIWLTVLRIPHDRWPLDNEKWVMWSTGWSHFGNQACQILPPHMTQVYSLHLQLNSIQWGWGRIDKPSLSNLPELFCHIHHWRPLIIVFFNASQGKLYGCLQLLLIHPSFQNDRFHNLTITTVFNKGNRLLVSLSVPSPFLHYTKSWKRSPLQITPF